MNSELDKLIAARQAACIKRQTGSKIVREPTILEHGIFVSVGDDGRVHLNVSNARTAQGIDVHMTADEAREVAEILVSAAEGSETPHSSAGGADAAE